ncbi:NAC domain-containing protein 87-like isoform X2 [Syzygium oleosum]|uniref:NAC domain-containing protein 87-like isoform X2 n=1 Tax=Syzygium oleosum TaxID=219896 RepID=UPI0024BA42C5|nr:NAC domain-containing protein 87-like isoform X2 [Syzygium oleosum]
MGAVVIPNNLPVGYRFHPTDEECVDYYLKNRVRGFVDRPCIIPDVDICGWDPWQLPQKFHGESIIHLDDKVQEWWFFCLQTPQQVKRSTPSGYWKKTGKDRNVKARDTNRVIGTKKTIVFHIGRGSEGVRTNWVIQEYHLLIKDLNRNCVLCRLKLKRDKKADNSTIELEEGANNPVDLDSDLHQPDHEGSFPMIWIEEMLNSRTLSSFQPENRVQVALPNLLQLPQPALRSQNNISPFNIHQFMNIESPSFMDVSLDNDLTEESIQWESLFRTSEDDADVGDVQISDYFDADFFEGDQMQTQCGQSSNSQKEHPALMKNRRTRTIDSFHGFVPLEEKKGMVENKFNGSRVASEKPMPCPVLIAPCRSMAPPIHAASVKYYSKDEEQRFEKVKQETAAKNNKPECTSLDETAARAKYPKMPESPRIYSNEETRFEKVKKQEIASRNVKPECVSLDDSAAKAKVLEYKVHGSGSKSPKKTNGKEIEHAREKSNSVTALTRPTTNSTKSSTDFPLHNLVNVIVGIFLLFTITCQAFNF